MDMMLAPLLRGFNSLPSDVHDACFRGALNSNISLLMLAMLDLAALLTLAKEKCNLDAHDGCSWRHSKRGFWLVLTTCFLKLMLLGRAELLAKTLAPSCGHSAPNMGVSENWGVPYFGVLIIRILLFRVPDLGPLFSETPNIFRQLMIDLPARRVLTKAVLLIVSVLKVFEWREVEFGSSLGLKSFRCPDTGSPSQWITVSGATITSAAVHNIPEGQNTQDFQVFCHTSS